ncbi:receptor expression-enhancing protein 1 isoform X2 [Sphaerodactylus townsendi]|uniref:receptor expression-enhancing protein 1 isoform X2 n=1 Tax=Sphaerodactylus townsendi TaxID=933632 RepID=UPI002026BE3A|nr:receptor expression-enhancing protein 1 isoform X2 [Sphaerodactylus townsendi]
MVSWVISRLVVLIFGTLYPAYYSYKAVKSKDIKEYVKWMMYWIIFAIFTTVETFTDIFLCWFPFYYELKIAFVAWLLSPYTKGSSLLYRKFVHPTLSSKEKEIDDCLIQAKDRSYDALVHFGKRGLNVAATAAVMAASKGQGALSERLRSFSMQDLTTIRGESSSAVSPPPSAPTISVRKSIKQSQPKTARTASGSAGCLVCSCCLEGRIIVEGEAECGVVSEESSEPAKGVFPYDENSFECASKTKRDEAIEAPPRSLRPRFRKKSTSPLTSETL